MAKLRSVRFEWDNDMVQIFAGASARQWEEEQDQILTIAKQHVQERMAAAAQRPSQMPTPPNFSQGGPISLRNAMQNKEEEDN